jgi:hypothetical protein
MGDIDLDPASSALFNEAVRAKKFYTEAQNGFTKTWKGRVFLNPPGGYCDGNGKRVVKVKNKGFIYPDTEERAEEHYSAMCLWWFRLAELWGAGSVQQAVFIGFSIELLQRTQMYRAKMFPSEVVPMETYICVPRDRIPFNKIEDDTVVPGTSPTHANVIVWLPPAQQLRRKAHCLREFRRAFGRLGEVK